MTRCKGQDKLDQLQFDWCCKTMEEMYHKKVIDYVYFEDAWYISAPCSARFAENVGNHIQYRILYCPWCGEIISSIY